MTEEQPLNKSDILFGSVYIPDNYDDPEIKKMWDDCFEFIRTMNEWKRREDRKDTIKYALACAGMYGFVMANILFIGWYFS